jgi:hypothetical protein
MSDELRGLLMLLPNEKDAARAIELLDAERGGRTGDQAVRIEAAAIAIYESRVHTTVINGWSSEPEALRDRFRRAALAAANAATQGEERPGAVDSSREAARLANIRAYLAESKYDLEPHDFFGDGVVEGVRYVVEQHGLAVDAADAAEAREEALREALEELAGDYGCTLLEPPDPSMPPVATDPCRDRRPDEPDTWCYACFASDALSRSSTAPQGEPGAGT